MRILVVCLAIGLVPTVLVADAKRYFSNASAHFEQCLRAGERNAQIAAFERGKAAYDAFLDVFDVSAPHEVYLSLQLDRRSEACRRRIEGDGSAASE